MARKKSISDDELIHLFEQYLISQCSCDLSLVKIPRFGDYVRNNGYQNVADTTIRPVSYTHLTLPTNREG